MENKRDTIHEIRAFNRFYTVLLGFLERNYLDSGYSVTETRILFELKRNERMSANRITGLLHLDKGYMSRMIRSFEQRGLITRETDPDDRRALVIQLTPEGQLETERLIAITDREIGKLIEPLDAGACDDLCASMRKITKILTKDIWNEEVNYGKPL